MMKKESKEVKIPYRIDVNGSLGLLANGDIGLRAWREIKQKSMNNNFPNEEK